ncbi:PDR/VanB family oxidoreductase [Rossellomorea aquimaris]|uniref:PDR/VanB family oxidoreductase n=1 Tax=Rossellomorea aquimaris TaxID=189382 RepID=UPI0007D06439|nr:PDR/VanB family oxidoreductase [Rossellomorea aquimaris]
MNLEKTIRVTVQSIQQETPSIKSFTLSSVEGETLPLFSGGSHITTYIEKENEIIARSYSLTTHPEHNQSYRISISLSEASKGGSYYWHHHIQIGDTLRISYPKNDFPLSFKAKHHVFYAGGIGITPFLSMMAELQSEGGSFELHYAAKTKETCAFYSFIKEQYPKQTSFYFSQESESNRLSEATLLEHPIGSHVYFCGPEGFTRHFIKTAKQIGYPTCSIHYEQFTPPLPLKMNPFQVELTNGQTIYVTKEKTLLEALLESGIEVPYSCRLGRCGTCELEVLEGQVDHYDSFLSEEEKKNQDVIISCVSRAKSDKIVVK